MSDLDLRERLRQESGALPAPSFTLDGVQRAGRARRRRRVLATGAGLAVVVALAGFALAALPPGDPAPPAEVPSFAWDLAVGLDFTVEPDAVREALAGSPLVAEARLVDFAQVRRGGEIAPPPLAEPDPGSEVPVVVVALAAGADRDGAERELALVDGVAQVWPSPDVAHGRLGPYFADLRSGADLYGDDVEILQPGPGPEPAFDVAGLGQAVPLAPYGVAGDLGAEEIAAIDPPGDVALRRDPRYPVVNVGSLPGGDRLLVFGTSEGNLCAVALAPGAGNATGCDRMLADPTYGPVGSATHAGPGAAGGTVWARVPPRTAAVVATVAETTMWQRPVGGYAYFPVPEAGRVEIVALDADGSELGRWLYTVG